MMAWALMLTISTGNGVAIESIPFQTEEKCQTAVEIILTQHDRFWRRAEATCVQTMEE